MLFLKHSHTRVVDHHSLFRIGNKRWTWFRTVTTSTGGHDDNNNVEGIDEDLIIEPEEVSLDAFTSGRGRHERKDSITPEILQQRRRHYERITSWGEADDSDVRALEAEGFGRKQRIHTGYNVSRLFSTPSYSAADFGGSDAVHDEKHAAALAAAAAMTNYLADSTSQIGAGKSNSFWFFKKAYIILVFRRRSCCSFGFSA